MAGTTTQERVADQATKQIRDLNERMIDAGRRAGETYLDVYERSARAIAEVHERTGQASNVYWVQNAAKVQADFLRELAGTYAQTGRELLR